MRKDDVLHMVIPAHLATERESSVLDKRHWVPAFAGTTSVLPKPGEGAPH
jgi:hypothetical protein